MDAFFEAAQKLGDRIYRESEASKSDPSLFPEYACKFPRIAARAIVESHIHEVFALDDLLQWLYLQDNLPDQLLHKEVDVSPRIVLYYNDYVVLELIFWLHPTHIHSHHFQGAFAVMHGMSFHVWYDFILSQNIDDRILIGDFPIKRAEYLPAGSAASVWKGDAFTHKVYHTTTPTVSLLVKDKRDHLHWIYQYFLPHFGYRVDRDIPEGFREELLHLGSMLRTEHPAAEGYFRELLARREIHEVVPIAIQYLMETRSTKSISAAFAEDKRLRPWQEPFMEALATMRETRVVWERLKEREPSLLIALLQSFNSRQAIDAFLEQYYPKTELPERILTWISYASERRALGYTFNETALSVLGAMLQGLTPSAIAAKLRASYDSTESSRIDNDVSNLHQSLRAMPLLRPLFT